MSDDPSDGTEKADVHQEPFAQRSPWAKVEDESRQLLRQRRPCFLKLQELFEHKTVVSFFTSFAHPGSMIVDGDVQMLEEILHATRIENGLLLLLNSAGGDALAAERIVNVCRAYSGNRFEVLVPHMAKSAATMIAFGANAIYMSPTAELGPVDPQVAFCDERDNWNWISAEEYIRVYESLFETATQTPPQQRIEPHLQQLQRFDARYVEQLRSIRTLSDDISVKHLQMSMMQGLSAEKIREKVSLFLRQKGKGVHGRMVTRSECQDCGLNIKEVDLASPTWDCIWELYVRTDHVLKAATEGVRKVIESAETSLYAH